MSRSTESMLLELTPLLTNREGGGPTIVMMCGIAGSGKTTLSKAIIANFPSFTRLSIDENIAARHGICGVDYPADAYEAYSEEADALFESDFQKLLAAKQNIVLDRACYDKEDRDRFRTAIEAAGGSCILVFFRADREALWQRIRGRRQRGVDANGALEISRELLNAYVDGFEVPIGEGEIVFDVV